MSDTARLREDAERRCGQTADTVRQLAAINRRLARQNELFRAALTEIAIYDGVAPISAMHQIARETLDEAA